MRPPAAPLATSTPVAPPDLAAVQAPQAHSARYASDAQAWVASVAYVAGQRSCHLPQDCKDVLQTDAGDLRTTVA